MIMTGKTAIDAVTVRSGILVLIYFACHASLGKLFHHFNKLFAIIFKQVVGYCKYAT